MEKYRPSIGEMLNNEFLSMQFLLGCKFTNLLFNNKFEDMFESTFFGELMGTFVLILLGEGVVANVLLKETKGHNSGFIVIATAWGLAVTFGVFVAQKFGSQAAHLNPALSIAFGFQTGEWSNVPGFILAQLIGAFLGALVNWIFYYPHFSATSDQDSKFACFATSPAIKNTPFNFLSELIGTFILFLGASAIYSQPESGLGPYLVGALVFVIGLSLGGTTGYAINPARDFAPRLAHAILPIQGKGSSHWNYAWIPIIAPILGAIIGALFYI